MTHGSITGYTPVLSPLEAPATSALHPPLEGCDPVPLYDQAYAKLTRQSSIAAVSSGWMFATEEEVEPWWEIDLDDDMYVERVALWLAPVPEDTEVCVVVHAYPTPAGEPAEGAFRWHALVRDLPVASEGSAVLWIAADTVGRRVRVSLRREGGGACTLLVRGAEIQAARVFTDSLLGSYARAFTLFADRPLFSARATPGEGPFVVTHRYRDVWTAARHLAAALADAIEPGAGDDRVFLGLCTRNRPEWVIGDLAAVMRGYVVVPLAPSDGDDRLAAILARCPLTAVMVEGGDADRIARLASQCPTLRLIIVCDSVAPEGGPTRAGLADLLARGASIVAPPAKPRDARDLYSLLFTSGSSGTPKGAMRSYAGFHLMLESYGAVQPAVHLSFQPLSHLSERMFLPALLILGGFIGFSGGGAHLLSDLRALEPTSVGSVPRLYEIVHAEHRRRLAAAIAASPDEPREEVEARVLAETRAVFGGRLQAVGVGSAPVSPEVLAFLHRCFADIWVADGYGSTECGTITTAGRLRPNVEVKLVPVPGLAESAAERGEIWVRTPHLIDGYFGDAEATAASLDAEGFFATGDLGERTEDGGVRVVGRVRNVIKLGQGEFVAVDRVEAALAGCSLVDQIFVHPDATSSALVAVVVPHAGALADRFGIADASRAALAEHPEAAQAIVRALADHGRRAGLAGFELPRAVLIEAEPMTVASGLLTASGKLARPAAIAHYQARLAALDAAAPAIADDGSLGARLAAVVGGVVGRRVDPDERLHEGLGVDSLSVAEALRAVGAAIGREIPLSLWFEARSIADLARRLESGVLGGGAPAGDLPRRDLDLVPKADPAPISPARVPITTVILTGATGLLGAHLLEALVARTSAHVVCLVRAPSDEAAADRVRTAQSRLAIPCPEPSRWSAIAADLAAPRLGLGARWDAFAMEADAILHAAAVVSWLQPYEALRAPNVLGTAALLDLASCGRAKPFHFVSTISTAPHDGDESTCLTFERARAGGGYGLSKWVAERLVQRAGDRGHPVAVYRPSMITGHGERGLGNPDDYVHRYLRACSFAGRHLDLDGARLDMTPVDFVAAAIVALMTARPGGGETHHLTNVHQSLTYRALGEAMARAGVACAPASYGAFRRAAVEADGSPLRALASYFPEAGFAMHMGPWPAARTRAALAALGVTCPPVDDALVARYLAGLGLLSGSCSPLATTR